MNIGDNIPPRTFDTTKGLDSFDHYRGKWLILYFYPKDSTPGCTQEGQDFRDAYPQLQALHTEVLGISRDSLKAHENFKSKQGFPFELISDKEETLCQLFEVIKMKSMYGKQVRGIERSTFLFDPEGILRQEWRKLSVKGHVDEVIATIKDLQKQV